MPEGECNCDFVITEREFNQAVQEQQQKLKEFLGGYYDQQQTKTK
jgi:hypothetical protein